MRVLWKSSQAWLQNQVQNRLWRATKMAFFGIPESLSLPNPHLTAALDLLKLHLSNLVKKHSEAPLLSMLSLFTLFWSFCEQICRYLQHFRAFILGVVYMF